VGGLDMVGRDEFEAVKAIAVAAREENQLLKARLDVLEAKAAPTA
jgi:BMFP domain-containing protein YqiC